ncbi:MAG TPA: carbamoyltransferase HypF, partial [Raoultella sp.]|nr:carbamoyltransferase HypF [Raoultella sp.]
MNGVEIRIRGKVQGVGFRPFVWQLAQRLGRLGDVCNDGDGVLVRLLGDEAEFIPALARH